VFIDIFSPEKVIKPEACLPAGFRLFLVPDALFMFVDYRES